EDGLKHEGVHLSEERERKACLQLRIEHLNPSANFGGHIGYRSNLRLVRLLQRASAGDKSKVIRSHIEVVFRKHSVNRKPS
ncbi:hypothetical protein C0J52_07501, partial [Blattella germanica]